MSVKTTSEAMRTRSGMPLATTAAHVS
jgi:hypothetical protein